MPNNLKPSPFMVRILKFLASRPDAVISLHCFGHGLKLARLHCINKDGSHTSSPPGLPIAKVTTFVAMQKRGYLAYVRRRETGGSGNDSDWQPSFDLDHRISKKGRQALLEAIGKEAMEVSREPENLGS